MTVNMIGAIAGNENSRNVGHRAALGFDVAVLIHRDDAFENLRVRNVTNRNKYPGTIQCALRTGLHILQVNARDLVAT